MWLVLTFLAVLLWSVVNIINRYVVTKELRDPLLLGFFYTVVQGILFMGLGARHVMQGWLWLPVLAGILYGFAVLVYFYVLQKAEVSRVVPVLTISPILVSVYAALFLGEVLRGVQYAGFALILLGVLCVSAVPKKKYVLWGVAVAVLLATRNIMVKTATAQGSIWQVVFWMGVGSLVFSAGLLIVHHPHLKKRFTRGIEHILVSSCCAGAAFLFFTLALFEGPLSLITVLLQTQPAVVFIISLVMAKFSPSILQERVTAKIVVTKTFAVSLIILGAVLMLYL